MALIKCPECGQDISDKARICPHCKAYQRKKYFDIKKSLSEKKKEKPNIKEIIHDKKYIRIIVLIIFILLLFTFALLHPASIIKKNPSEMTDIEKIDKGAELFGEKVINGNVKCTQEFMDFAKNVSLFGTEGEFSHRTTGKSKDNKIDCLLWISQNKVGVEDFDRVIDGLCDLYGRYNWSNIKYMDIEGCYQWERLTDYSFIICGMKKDEIYIFWIK